MPGARTGAPATNYATKPRPSRLPRCCRSPTDCMRISSSSTRPGASLPICSLFRPTALGAGLLVVPRSPSWIDASQGTSYAATIARPRHMRSGAACSPRSTWAADTLKLVPAERDATGARSVDGRGARAQGMAVPHEHTLQLAHGSIPLTSFWLDMLVLRPTNAGQPSRRPVWLTSSTSSRACSGCRSRTRRSQRTGSRTTPVSPQLPGAEPARCPLTATTPT